MTHLIEEIAYTRQGVRIRPHDSQAAAAKLCDLLGLNKQVQENRIDRRRNQVMYEGMIAAAQQAAAGIGAELTRREAIEVIKVSGFPEVTRHVQ